MLDFADEMGIDSIVLLDEPSESDLERIADSEVTVILSIGSDGIADWGKGCARRLMSSACRWRLGPVAVRSGAGRPRCSTRSASPVAR